MPSVRRPSLCAVLISTVVILLAGPGARAQAIEPNDVLPYVRIFGPSVEEGAPGVTTDAVFTIELSEASSRIVTGFFTTIDGTAKVSDGDYELGSGNFTIPAQSRTTTIVVKVRGDSRGEPDERFTVQVAGLQNATNAYGPTSATATILNDDSFVSVKSQEIDEGNVGTNDVIVSIELTGPATQTVIGSYRTVDGTATTGDSDYQSRTGSFTIAAGSSSTSIRVPIVGDTRVEDDETFRVELFNVSTGSGAAGTVTIRNDDQPAPFVLRVLVSVTGPGRVTEGDSGTRDATFRIVVDANAASTITVSTTDSSATAADGDYLAVTNSTITVPSGMSTHTIDVKVNGDITPEEDETFSLTVTSQTNSATATATIVDDDKVKPAGISIAAGDGQAGTVGQKIALPLTALVSNALGRPIADAEVKWEVTKGSATVQPATSKTNLQGTADTIVTLGTDSGRVEVTASTTIAGERKSVVFKLSSISLAETAGNDPVSLPIAEALEKACAAIDPSTEAGRILATACDTLRGLQERDELGNVFQKIAPQQAATQIKAILQSLTIATTGLTSRLTALRGGAGGFSVDQLSLNLGGRAVPMGALAQTFLPQRGGAAGDEDNGGLSGFISGSLGSGDRRSDAANGVIGYDLDFRGVTVGVDHTKARRALGVAVSLTELESVLDDDGGTLDTNGYSLSVYAAKFDLTKPRKNLDGAYVDAYLTYGRNEYDSKHVVTIGSTTSVSTSDNISDMYSAGGSLGISGHSNAFSFDAFVRGSYASAKVDGFVEDGTNPLRLSVESQQVDSLLATVGLDVAYAWSTSWGVLRPSLRGSLLHEFEDGARLITARFVNDRQQNPFTVPLDKPDRNFANIAAGLQALFPHGWSTFVQFSKDTGRSDIDFQAISFGIRKEF